MILQIIYRRISRNHLLYQTGGNVDSNLVQAYGSGLKQNYSFLYKKNKAAISTNSVSSQYVVISISNVHLWTVKKRYSSNAS